jgi:hypothetical protein
MNRPSCLTVLILVCLAVSGCVFGLSNYAKVRNISDERKDVTIDRLIEDWKHYDIYYAGLDVKAPLGIVFDSKDNNTKLTGDQWKKVKDKKILIEITRWIYPHTQFFPYLVELLSPDNRFLGYLYYSWGPVVIKNNGDSTFYMLNLDDPNDLGGESCF